MKKTFVTWITAAVLTCLQAQAFNLPPALVTITITGGDDSFFDATLSGVPAGYDIGNSTYLAWCIDLINPNDPTINGGVHTGTVASLSGPLPRPFAGKPWDRILYLLNHKQGTATDIQYAIWHFTDGFDPDPNVNPLAIAMIQDAEANGAGFTPGPGDVQALAIIWSGEEPESQHVIVELPPGNECTDRFTAGGFIYRNGKKVSFGIQGGMHNGRLWGGINFVDHGTRLHVQSRNITSYTVLSDNCRRATYAVRLNGVAQTATVRVCDNGEPGRNDVVEITLSDGYSAGAGSTIGGNGRGGGNVQLHKPRCTKKPATTRPGHPRAK